MSEEDISVSSKCSQEDTPVCSKSSEDDAPNYGGFGSWVCDTPHDSQDPTPTNLFRPGMGIELNELNYPSMFCVGSIKRVCGDYVLAHFDGWEDYWDVWYRWDAPEMRPVGTCNALNWHLYAPYQGSDADIWGKTGNWASYLAYKNNIAAPIEAFSKLFMGEFDDNSLIPPLLVLAANKVASIAHCYVGLGEFIGTSLNEKIKNTQVCTVCNANYLVGYKCVKSFTIQSTLKSKSSREKQTGLVCSLPCLAFFKEKFIGNFGQEKYISKSYVPDTVQSSFHHFLSDISRDKTVSVPQPTDVPSHCNKFRPGMKIEGVDANYPTMFCPCTILRSCEDDVLIHFDGWGHSWDIWYHWNSPLIRPIGTVKMLKYHLTDFYGTIDSLNETNSVAAPVDAFSKLYVCEFGDSIPSLGVLAINTLVHYGCTIQPGRFKQIFPFEINGKPLQLKSCYICKKRYYFGWLAVAAFTIPSDLQNSSCIGKLCSMSCLQIFHKEKIGFFI